METTCLKCQILFTGKNETNKQKKRQSVLAAELTQSVVKVKPHKKMLEILIINKALK